MTTKKVAICGTYWQDTTGLIDRLAIFAGSLKPEYEYIGDPSTIYSARMMHLSIISAPITFELVTLAGPVFSTTRFYTEVLQHAQTIIYVISAGLLWRGRDSEGTAWKEQQQKDFQQYTSLSRELGVLWPKTPWIWLMMVDAEEFSLQEIENPLASKIPTQAFDDIIRCDVQLGQGIDLLWRKLLTTISIS